MGTVRSVAVLFALVMLALVPAAEAKLVFTKAQAPQPKTVRAAGAKPATSVQYSRPEAVGNRQERPKVSLSGGEGTSWPDIVEVNIPEMSVDLMGEEFSIGGGAVCLRLKVVKELANTNAAGGWTQGDPGFIEVTERRLESYAKAGLLRRSVGGKVAFVVNWLFCSYNTGAWTADGAVNEFRELFLHEAVHGMVDQKYLGRWRDRKLNENYYNFMSEMLAYTAGSGKTDLEAAKHIAGDDSYESIHGYAKEFIRYRTGRKDAAPAGPAVADRLRVSGWCHCGPGSRQCVIVGFKERPVARGYAGPASGLVYWLCVNCGHAVAPANDFPFPVRGRTRKDIVMWRNESMVRMCAKYGVSGIAEAMQLPQSQLIDFLETFMNEQDALLAKPAGAPLVSGACTCSSSASVDCADGHGGRRRVCSDCGKVKGL